MGAVISTVSITELLTKFFGPKGLESKLLENAEIFLQTLPNCLIRSTSYGIARLGAKLRANFGLRTPDALIAATGISERATHFITNDVKLLRLGSEQFNVIVLKNYVAPTPTEQP